MRNYGFTCYELSTKEIVVIYVYGLKLPATCLELMSAEHDGMKQETCSEQNSYLVFNNPAFASRFE